MPRQKPTDDDLDEREQRAKEWKEFKKTNLFTEVRLAEILGISRRTVQMVLAARVTPQPGTIRKWNTLTAKYKRNKVA